MVCGQIHAPATLHNNVHTCLMNTKFLASLYSLKQLYVFFFNAERLFLFIAFSINIYSSDFDESNFRSLIHYDTRCCYRNSVCDGVLRITSCLLCTPLWTTELLIWHLKDEHFPSMVQRQTLCLRSQDMLLLKRTSTNCRYRINATITQFPCVSSISVRFLVHYRRTVRKIRVTGRINSPTQISIGN